MKTLIRLVIATLLAGIAFCYLLLTTSWGKDEISRWIRDQIYLRTGKILIIEEPTIHFPLSISAKRVFFSDGHPILEAQDVSLTLNKIFLDRPEVDLQLLHIKKLILFSSKKSSDSSFELKKEIDFSFHITDLQVDAFAIPSLTIDWGIKGEVDFVPQRNFIAADLLLFSSATMEESLHFVSLIEKEEDELRIKIAGKEASGGYLQSIMKQKGVVNLWGELVIPLKDDILDKVVGSIQGIVIPENGEIEKGFRSIDAEFLFSDSTLSITSFKGWQGTNLIEGRGEFQFHQGIDFNVKLSPFQIENVTVGITELEGYWREGGEGEIRLRTGESTWKNNRLFEQFNLFSHFFWLDEKINLEELEGKIDAIPFSLRAPATLSLTSGGFFATPFSFQMGEGILEFEGTFTEQIQKGRLAISQFPLPFLRFLDEQAESPTLFLEGLIDEELLIKLVGSLEIPSLGTYLELSGILPLKPTHSFFPALDWEKELFLQVAHRGELAILLDILLPDNIAAKGFGKMELIARGSLEAPYLEGGGIIRDGALEEHESGLSLRQIEVDFKMENDRIIVQRVTARDRENGTVAGEGNLALDGANFYPLKLQLSLQNLHVVELDYVKGNATGQLTLEGNFKEAKVNAEVIVNPFQINLPKRLPGEITTVEVQYMHGNRAVSPPIPPKKSDWPLSLDILLHFSEPFSIRGESLSSTWHGEVKIEGTLETPLLKGGIRLKNGDYEFNGKEFVLTQGTMSFAGELSKKTTIYLIASKQIDRLKIDVILKGPLNDLGIAFRSNPPLPQKEILSWLLFNRGSGNLTDSEGAELSHSFTKLSTQTQQKGSNVLENIRNRLPFFDQIDFSQLSEGENGEVAVQLGKHLWKNIFISVNKGLSTTTEDSVSIEAELKKNVKLKAKMNYNDEAELQLKWFHDY